MRDAKIDLDNIIPQVWATEMPDTEIPDKIAHATLFMSPLVRVFVRTMQTFQPDDHLANPPHEVAALKARIAELESLAEAGRPAAGGQAPGKTKQPGTATRKIARGRTTRQSPMKSPTRPAALDASRAFQPPKSSKKLTSCSPRSATDFAVTAWIGKFKKDHIPEDKHQEFDAFQADIKQWYEAQEADNKPGLKEVSEKWGLPKALSTKLAEKSLLGLIATAAYEAA
jgi:hypothetical protein